MKIARLITPPRRKSPSRPGLPSRNSCTGCSACVQVCKAGAIALEEGTGGFRFPVIDERKCLACGACERVCPVVFFKKNRPARHVRVLGVIAAQSLDSSVLLESSSGGAADVLVRSFVRNGGLAAGAVWDERLAVRHAIAENESETIPFRRSKYVQSDVGLAFSTIDKAVRSGRNALFVGTPCQVAGLLGIVGKEGRRRLTTITLFCHGVPSQRLFDDYREFWNRRSEHRMTAFSFRTKSRSWNATETAWFDTGSSDGVDLGKWYLRCFGLGLSTRPCCAKCLFRHSPPGDLVLGDYWSFPRSGEKLNRRNGISKIVVMTERGADLWNRVSSQFNFVTRPLSEARLDESRPFGGIRFSSFLDDYDRQGVEYVFKHYPPAFLLWQRDALKAFRRRLCNISICLKSLGRLLLTRRFQER